MGVGGSGQPERGTGSAGQGPSIHQDVVTQFWRQVMCGIQYCDSKWPWHIYYKSHTPDWKLCLWPWDLYHAAIFRHAERVPAEAVVLSGFT